MEWPTVERLSVERLRGELQPVGIRWVVKGGDETSKRLWGAE